jgi:integrase
LIAAANDNWKLPIKMLYFYGMRASELMSLTPANIKNGVLVIKRLKHGKLTRQVLHPEIKAELLALAASKDAAARLFPHDRKSLWEAIRTAGNRAGLDPRVCHPHAFRHACGRKWARQFSVNVCGAMLCHKSISATMMYTDLPCDPDLSRKVFGLE